LNVRCLRRAAAVALALLAAPLAADAQQAAKVYRVGVLHSAFLPNIPSVDGLKSGLKAAGLEEGREVTFDIRFTRGDLEATPAAATALATAGVDLIFTNDEIAPRAAKAATQTIPIVFTQVGDPVAAGFVKEIAHPGGNVTGVSSLTTELVPKRLETLKELIPALRRVWAIYHTGDFSSRAAARRAEEVASLLRLEVVVRAVRTPEELVAQLKSLRVGDALLVPPTAIMNIQGLMLDVQLMNRVPAVFESAFWVQAGGLVSYGAEASAQGVQAARLVARILRGARPQDLPVEGANKIDLAINLKTAKALGLTIPQTVRVRTDQVVQ
jgi:putative ABC transport system substrate-binding protein